MTATKVLVCKKVADSEAQDLIKCHPLTPELATELFAQKGVGTFRFSAALIEWSKFHFVFFVTQSLQVMDPIRRAGIWEQDTSI